MSRILVICPPFAASTLTTMFSNSAAIVQAAFEVERILEILTLRRRRRADLAGGDFLALLLDGVDHVLRRQGPRLKQVRVHPDAHRVLSRRRGSSRRRRP